MTSVIILFYGLIIKYIIIKNKLISWEVARLGGADVKIDKSAAHNGLARADQ